MHREPSRTVQRLVGIAAAVLALLHHDFWLWDDRRLLLGFLPSGLAYHVLFSLGAAALWVAAVRWAWPGAWERWAEADQPGPKQHPPEPEP